VDVTAWQARTGETLGTSAWLTIDQAMIDTHAATTGDADWLHNDVERARRESPFGATIAQGSLLIGNLVRLQEQALSTADDPTIAYALNYGFDRVRFVQPVLAGSRVRAHLVLQAVRRRDETSVVVELGVTLELEGSERPAMVATWLGLLRAGEAPSGSSVSGATDRCDAEPGAGRP
jgi:acyl dehydratase